MMRFQSIILALVVAATFSCASGKSQGPLAPRLADNKEVSPCKPGDALGLCLEREMIEGKYARLLNFCQDRIQRGHAAPCIHFVPLALWRTAHVLETEAFWKARCEDEPLADRVDAVTLVIIRHIATLSQQGVPPQQLRDESSTAMIDFSRYCNAPIEAVGVALKRAGAEMKEKNTLWPQVSCRSNPECMAALPSM